MPLSVRQLLSEDQEPLEIDHRRASIKGADGRAVFDEEVLAPVAWSDTAVNIFAQKFLRVVDGAREVSILDAIERVAGAITSAGVAQGYLDEPRGDRVRFYSELRHILFHQLASFNSPVWFNCGFEKAPQCSACFINAVQDTMDSILTLAKTEGMLFKFGSGTGSNLSSIRSSREVLAGGGTASGPVSFMKGFDAFAGVIKSGGKTRRAAKMVILNADHPDVVEFINCKVEEEKKAWALIDAGYDGSFTGPAYASVFFQNSNNSVRVTDEFMRAVLDDGEWQTRAVRNGEVMDTYRARDLMRMIAEGTWVCGDPGMQFDTTINAWHTCPNTSRIEASNPCSEYMFLNDSACNLASLNLLRFHDPDAGFDVEAFRHACEIVITAQEILVDNASYLLELCRYVVLNPVRAGMVHAARRWRWSSFRATAGLVKAPDWLAADGVLGNFGLDRQKAPLAYRQFVRQGTKASSPWDSLRGQTWLGSDEFSGPTGRVDGQPSCRPATAPAFPATASGESVRAAPRMSRCRHGSRFCRG